MAASSIDIRLGRHAVALARKLWGENTMLPIGPYLTALQPLEPQCDLIRQWHVVQTEPQQETKVAELLKAAKMDSYCPQQPRSVRVNAICRRTVMRPMLVGYVFAGFDVRFDRWELIRDMRGVLKLIQVKERPLPIAFGELDFIRLREAELTNGKNPKRPPIPHKIDDVVQLTEDAWSWSGCFGRVTKLLASQDRIVVGIDVFGRVTPVEVSVNQVRAV
jgi:transcription termination/antitermination protein NusG